MEKRFTAPSPPFTATEELPPETLNAAVDADHAAANSIKHGVSISSPLTKDMIEGKIKKLDQDLNNLENEKHTYTLLQKPSASSRRSDFSTTRSYLSIRRFSLGCKNRS